MKKNIEKEIEKIFPNTNKEDSKFSISGDKTGKSIIYYTSFKYKTKDQIRIECYDYSKTYEEKRNVSDGLSVSIKSYETTPWLEQTSN